MTEAEVQAARRDRGALTASHGVPSGGEVWDSHPTVRGATTGLTLGERAADKLRNGMGSWTFVFGALGFLAVWMAVNVVDTPLKHWDAYPFILLNLTLSCLAALQGAILLIAAKRADAIAAELAQHDLDSDLQSEEILRVMQQDFIDMKRLIVELHGQRFGTGITAPPEGDVASG